MFEIILGVFCLIIGFLILDHNREFAMPRGLDVVPAILILMGVAAVAAGVFRIV